MKLIIQIPCFNEAPTLPIALAALPRRVLGFDQVEWLIVDDGSQDDTVGVARACGVDHVVRHSGNLGLARAFTTGLEACLARGADVIVNTDADNQYNAADIPALVRPICDGKADIVVGARPIDEIGHFSAIKKLLQKLGSWVVRTASRTDIPDTTSGFRAYSRVAAQRLSVFSNYTYTLETIIQAGQGNIAITSVPIRVNADLRPSRLVKSIRSYVTHSISTIVRIFIIYRPATFFGLLGGALLSVGVIVGARFLYFLATRDGTGHIQSLILASILIGAGFQTVLVAIIADLLATNRKLLEDIRFMMRRLQTGRDAKSAVENEKVPLKQVAK
jgi:glycosyltransferase involved in cell wall biosynthesis